jgi:hypothetical protein
VKATEKSRTPQGLTGLREFERRRHTPVEFRYMQEPTDPRTGSAPGSPAPEHFQSGGSPRFSNYGPQQRTHGR